MTIRIEWGATSLMQLEATADRPFTIAASADGTDWGNPQAVITAIRSRLSNGSLAGITSYDNRDGVVFLEIASTSYDGLAAGEAALMAEASVDGFNTLKWSPSIELARTTVFDVVYAKLIFEFNDYSEVAQLKRRFRVEFNSLPFGREETLTTVQATVAGPTTPVTTPINDAAAATGWTATAGSAPASASGQVSTTANGIPIGHSINLDRTANFFFSGLFIYVDWKAGARTTGATLSVLRSSTVYNLSPVASPDGSSPAAGYVRTWYQAVSGIFGTNQALEFSILDALPNEQVFIDQVVRVDNSNGTGQTVIDDGSSTTNWSVVSGGGLISTGGALRVTAYGDYAPSATYLNLSAAIDATATPYVYVDWKQGTRTSDAELTVTTGAGTQVAARVGTVSAALAGYTRTYFQLPANATAFAFGFTAVPRGQTLSIDQVTKTNIPPTIGTQRQRLRALTIGGAAPSQAAMSMTAGAGQTLGKGTLIYSRTATTGFQPPLRAYLVSSSATNDDTATVSGKRHTLAAASVYRFPASKIRAAAHALVGLLRSTAGGTFPIGYTAKLTSAAGADIPESVVTTTGTTTVTIAADTLFGFIELANLQLPTVVVAPDSDCMITLTITGAAGVEVDDFFLCDLDNGVMSLIDTTGLTRLELRTPSLTAPEESVWGGYVDGGAATGLIRQDYRVKSLGQHVLPPGTNEVFTACTGSDTSALSAAYYRSFHTNVGAPAA